MSNNKDTFGKWYKALPLSVRDLWRKKIISECYISNKTFYDWTNGILPRPLYQIKINEILQQNLFKVEKLKTSKIS